MASVIVAMRVRGVDVVTRKRVVGRLPTEPEDVRVDLIRIGGSARARY